VIEVKGTITYTDGRVTEYTATQREFAAWERYALRHGLPTGTDGGPTAQLTMARYLAYSALNRGDENPVSFEVFDAEVAEVAADEDPRLLDPTRPARSAD
jgi:hypothetical protein